MLARAFLAFLLVATNYCEKTHAAPASEEGNHLGDHKHLLKSGKITFDSTDSILDMPGEPLSPADFRNAKLLPLEPPLRDVVDGAGTNEMGVLFEGDIAGVLPRDKMRETGRRKGTKLKNAVVDMTLTWPSGVVPYVISASFGGHERSVIAKAILEYHKKTCIRFVPRKGQTDYLNILSGNGCYSNVGRTGGEQQVSLGNGCIHLGTIMHELMHAVGFWHEQSRTDRDNYIIIHWNNIIDGMTSNFQKLEQNRIQYLGLPYDIGSIMHYDAYAFAKNVAYPTVTAKKKDGKQLGQREGFSEADVLKLNRLYKCETSSNEKSNSTISPLIMPTESPEKAKAKGRCDDEHKYCKIWMEQGECAKNPWMNIHCRQSCNQCEECGNYKAECIPWAQEGECSKNSDYMKIYCRKSCGYCGETESSRTPKTDCVDDGRYCRVWAAMGNCEANPAFMLLHCKDSCGAC